MMKTLVVMTLVVAAMANSSFKYSDQESWGDNCNSATPDTAKQSPVNLFTGMGGANAELFDKMLKLQGDAGNVFAEASDPDQSRVLEWQASGLPEESVITGFHALAQQTSAACPGTLSNNGHTLKFTPAPEVTNAGALTSPGPRRMWADGVVYDLKQIHFHSPSEHLVNGKQYPLEAHFVHANEDGELAVVGVFFSDKISGEGNSALDDLFTGIPQIGAERGIRALDIGDLAQTGAFYSYMGSLTTPPCTEGVRWIVFKAPKSMSSEQLVRFNKFYRANNRDVQPLNGRFAILNGANPFSVSFPELDCSVDNSMPHCPGFVAD